MWDDAGVSAGEHITVLIPQGCCSGARKHPFETSVQCMKP